MNQTTKNMKKLALILFLIPSLAFSQDSVELKVIQYLNVYRTSKGLSKLEIDQGLCKAAEYQVQYEFLCDKVTHTQDQDFPGFREIPEFCDRVRYFCGPEGPSPVGEITLGSEGNLSTLNPEFLNNLPGKVVNWFKESPSHNQIMLERESKKVGIKLTLTNDHFCEGKRKMRFFCVIVFGS